MKEATSRSMILGSERAIMRTLLYRDVSRIHAFILGPMNKRSMFPDVGLDRPKEVKIHEVETLRNDLLPIEEAPTRTHVGLPELGL